MNSKLELSITDIENGATVLSVKHLDLGNLEEELRREKMVIEGYLEAKLRNI